MAERMPSATLSFAERSFASAKSKERLPRWFVVSFVAHMALIAALFLSPHMPTEVRTAPVYTVDLVGGEKIGGANLGTELPAPVKPAAKNRQDVPEAPAKTPVKEVKKTPPEKEEKPKPVEKKPPVEEKIVLREKTKTEPVKSETPAKRETRESKPAKADAKAESKSESASADSVRERLIQSAVDRAKMRSEATQTAKGEVLSAGSGEGEGAAALGTGGRGGPGIVKGMDFIIYQNRMLATIKENWAWVGQRSNLRVVVQFGVKENGEIVGLKIVQPSGDPSYDESVLRAVKKSSPLPAPPENYRKDFADVELTFRPRDLGA
jgi:colicin import membrane protein